MRQLNIRFFPPLACVFLGVFLGISSLPIAAKKVGPIFPYEKPLDFFIRSRWSATTYLVFIPSMLLLKCGAGTIGLILISAFKNLKKEEKKQLNAIVTKIFPGIMHTIIAIAVFLDLHFFFQEIGYLAPI